MISANTDPVTYTHLDVYKRQELLKNHHIDPNLYVEYNVKRGLRDSAGKGVLTGLTEISDVNGYNPVSYTHLLYISGFWHIHAKTPRRIVMYEQ